MMTDDIDQLLTFGRMGLETGYYEQARDSFGRVLELDPDNREAMRGLGRANEMLRRQAASRLARRHEPAPPPPTVEPQRTIPGMGTQEWQRSPLPGGQEQSRLEDREDDMESKADDGLQWLSSQLEHVPIKTWIIVFVKMGVAYMVLMFILMAIAFVASLILAQVDVSIMEVLGDFL
jgi:hypothetical protein